MPSLLVFRLLLAIVINNFAANLNVATLFTPLKTIPMALTCMSCKSRVVTVAFNVLHEELPKASAQWTGGAEELLLAWGTEPQQHPGTGMCTVAKVKALQLLCTNDVQKPPSKVHESGGSGLISALAFSWYDVPGKS
jgi:hypothetical protein